MGFCDISSGKSTNEISSCPFSEVHITHVAIFIDQLKCICTYLNMFLPKGQKNDKYM